MAKINYFSLGGQDEKWKYSGLLEINNEIFILNIGVGCKITNQYGIQKAIPDLNYIKKNSARVKGLFIGTPRKLNIGSLPYLLDLIPNLNLYTSSLGKEIITEFLDEAGASRNRKYSPNFCVLNNVNEVQVGGVKVCAVKVANCIPNSYAWMFKTALGENVIFIDEFLISNENVPCSENQLHVITQQVKNKANLLIVGTQSVGQTPSFSYQQAQNFNYLKKACSSTQNRVFAALYEDDWYTLLNLSKVAKIYSMNFHITCPRVSKLFNFYLEQIKSLDYAYSNKFVDTNDSLIAIVGDHDTLYERLSHLQSEENEVHLKDNDLVIIATITHPEKEVEEINLINQLSKKEITIRKQPKSHVPYQAGDEDIKALINSIAPFNIVPVNCYYKDYVNFCKALRNTINTKRIFFLEIGQALEIDGKNTKIIEVPVTEQYVNAGGVVEINKSILLERRLITENGAILLSVFYNPDKHVIVVPEIQYLGFFTNENEEKEKVISSVKNNIKNEMAKYLSLNQSLEIKTIKLSLKKAINNAIEAYTHKKPMILPLITNLN